MQNFLTLYNERKKIFSTKNSWEYYFNQNKKLSDSKDISVLDDGDLFYREGSFSYEVTDHSCFSTRSKDSTYPTNYADTGNHDEESILKVDITGDWEVTQVLHNGNWYGGDGEKRVYVVTDA